MCHNELPVTSYCFSGYHSPAVKYFWWFCSITVSAQFPCPDVQWMPFRVQMERLTTDAWIFPWLKSEVDKSWDTLYITFLLTDEGALRHLTTSSGCLASCQCSINSRFLFLWLPLAFKSISAKTTVLPSYLPYNPLPHLKNLFNSQFLIFSNFL